MSSSIDEVIKKINDQNLGKILYLNNKNLNNEDIYKLSTALVTDENITEIHLSKNCFDSKGLIALTDALLKRNEKNISKLDISYNNFNSLGIIYLGLKLASYGFQPIRSLNLSKCNINIIDALIFYREVYEYSHLVILDLSKNKISFDLFKNKLQLIKDHTPKFRVNIDNSYIDRSDDLDKINSSLELDNKLNHYLISQLIPESSSMIPDDMHYGIDTNQICKAIINKIENNHLDISPHLSLIPKPNSKDTPKKSGLYSKSPLLFSKKDAKLNDVTATDKIGKSKKPSKPSKCLIS